MYKTIISLTLAIILSLILGPTATAAPKVQFEGGADNFVFYPETGWSDTDLFGSLKNIMPGDRRSETITIKNIASEYDYVKLYLRAEPAANDAASTTGDITMQEFLSQFEINVHQDGKLISSSQASDAGQLTTNFLLGTFKNGDEGLLTAEIIAPTDLGNKYMHANGEIKWIFTAEVYKDGVIINPYTNDNVIKYIAIATMATVIIVIAAASILRHRKSQQHTSSSN